MGMNQEWLAMATKRIILHLKVKDDEAAREGDELAKEEEEAAAPNPNPIHGDVLEAILTRLTLLDLVAASRVSKAWRSAVSTSLRISPRNKPWFIVYTLHHHHHNHYLTTAYAFDPSSRVWLRFNIAADIHHFTTTTTTNTSAYPALLRSSDSQHLLYTLSAKSLSFSFDALHLTWHQVETPHVWRQDPIVARLGTTGVLVAGATCDFVNDPFAVGMYDIETRRWDTCEPIPVLLKYSATGTWISTAANPNDRSRRLYLLEKHSLVICAFDAETKTWGPTFNLILRPVTVFHSIIGFAHDRLILVGLMGVEGDLHGLGLWEVDQVSYECREIGEMPTAMVESLRDASPRASMEGEFIYVYTASNPEQIFFCELELEEGMRMCRWGHVVNPMASDHNWMHRLVFTCSRVGMGDLQKAVATGSRRFTVESESNGDGFSSFCSSSATPTPRAIL